MPRAGQPDCWKRILFIIETVAFHLFPEGFSVDPQILRGFGFIAVELFQDAENLTPFQDHPEKFPLDGSADIGNFIQE
jgi:hypothetical protein